MFKTKKIPANHSMIIYKTATILFITFNFTKYVNQRIYESINWQKYCCCATKHVGGIGTPHKDRMLTI